MMVHFYLKDTSTVQFHLFMKFKLFGSNIYKKNKKTLCSLICSSLSYNKYLRLLRSHERNSVIVIRFKRKEDKDFNLVADFS